MASITYDAPQRGWTIAGLPLPDGSYKAYRDRGKGAFQRIITLWKMECRLMCLAIKIDRALAACAGVVTGIGE